MKIKNKIPFITNLDLIKYPLIKSLKCINKYSGNRVQIINTIRIRSDSGFNNYYQSLKSIGVLSRDDKITLLGKALLADQKHHKEILARYLVLKTNFGLVLKAFELACSHYVHTDFEKYVEKILFQGFDFEPLKRNQWINYARGLFRYCNLIDKKNNPNVRYIEKVIGNIKYNEFLLKVAKLSNEERIMLQALLRVQVKEYDTKEIKDLIWENFGIIVDTGLGGKAVGKKLRDKKLIIIHKKRGRGKRSFVRLNKRYINLLQSPLVKVHFRINEDGKSVLEHLENIIKITFSKLLEDIKKNDQKKDHYLELFTAKIAFSLGCEDITIRAREETGEIDVLGSIESPIPQRMVIQCKAHKNKISTNTLYRELAMSLLMNNVRTILLFSTSGYTNSLENIWKKSIAQFPSLTILLFDETDLDKICINETNLLKIFKEKSQTYYDHSRRKEEYLLPNQIVHINSILKIHNVKNRKKIIQDLTKIPWEN